MPTAAPINFPHFTNVRILWANVSAVNNFFESLTVTIGGDNLPAATVDSLGGVKLLEIGAFAPGAVNGDVVNINTIADDGTTVVSSVVPSIAAYNSSIARIALLEAAFQNLYAQLLAKGYVAT
jgi:hypothetical protein